MTTAHRPLRRLGVALHATLAAALLAGAATAQGGHVAERPLAGRTIVVASTTSTENSGLFDRILPRFAEATGIEVRVVALGTGQALEVARRGDADVLLVHHRPSEAAFVEDGYGLARHDVMYNDFVVVGPADDPAGIAGGEAAPAALAAIADARAPFVSRGDDSGTHKKELALWQAADLDPEAFGGWYRPVGSGMGATLNTAAEMRAYTLADRGTWLAFENKRDLAVLVDGDDRLFNPYGAIVVDPEVHPHVDAEAGQAFVDWLTSATGQAAIASHTIDGTPLFVPNAAPPDG